MWVLGSRKSLISKWRTILKPSVKQSSTSLFITCARASSTSSLPPLTSSSALVGQLPPQVDPPVVRSDWYYIGLAAIAIAAVIGPVAVINELQTDFEIREWEEIVDSSILPLLRDYVDIPHDEAFESRAADKPRGQQLVHMSAFHVSGRISHQKLPASLSMMEAAAAFVTDPLDPIVDVCASDVVMYPTNPLDQIGHPIERARAIASVAAMFPRVVSLGYPSALGALQTKDSLLQCVARVEGQLADVAKVSAEVESSLSSPLSVAILREEQAHLHAVLDGLHRQLDMLPSSGSVTTAPSHGPFWTFFGRIAYPTDTEMPSLRYFSTRGESARIADRVLKVRRRLGTKAIEDTPAQLIPDSVNS